MKKTYFLLTLLLPSLYAEDLKTTVNELLNTNPVILERLKNYNATKEDITIAKAGYYPKLDINLGAGVEKIDKYNLANGAPNANYSYNVYQNSLKYTHNIFNGFSTTYQVKEQEYRTLSAAYSYIEKVNDRSFNLVNHYIETLKQYELLENSKENVAIDEEIFVKVQKLYDSGLTTLSEVNKIQSSLALAKSNLIVQENTLLNVRYQLEGVLGRYLDSSKMVEPTINVALPKTKEEAAQFAILNNPSLLVSEYNIRLAQATNREKNSLYYPKIDIEISESMSKNQSAIKGNNDTFKAMALLSYNIFNGFSDQANIQKSISQMHQEVQSKNSLRRQVIEGLNLAFIAQEKLSEQLAQLQVYKEYSFETLTLYQKEYDLGRRSLLDLLSSQNDFISSKAQIINTKYNLLYAKYRVLDAMGVLVDSILGDENQAYGTVGLIPKATMHQSVTLENTSKSDSLPIQYDRDNDLIPNDRDLCDNSLSSDMKNLQGCAQVDKNATQIERYSQFLFVDYKLQSEKELNNLITQLKPYGLDNVKIQILGNAQSQKYTAKELLTLSQIRANIILNLFSKAGFKQKNITTIANGDTAPIFSGQDERNNRVDIIVTKLK